MRKIKRGQEGVELGRTPSQQVRMAHQQVCPTWPSLPQQEHINNDALILGFNFEPKDEGMTYMNQDMNVIPF